jgi:hypothetical protein
MITIKEKKIQLKVFKKVLNIQVKYKYIAEKGILVMSSNKKRNDLSLSSSVVSLEGIKLTNKDFS